MLTKETTWFASTIDGVEYAIKFWSTGKVDRHGREKLCVAVFEKAPSYPNSYVLVWRVHDYYPSLLRSACGEESVRTVLGFLEHATGVDLYAEKAKLTEDDGRELFLKIA